MKLLAAVLVVVGACGDDGAGGDASVPIADAGIDAESWGAEDLRGACAQNTRSGKLELNHVAAPTVMTGNFTAAVTDGINPNHVLDPLEEEGECRLYRRENNACPLPCTPTQVCSDELVCVTGPRNLDVGDTVEVFGLGEPLIVERTVVNDYFDSTLPNPPFAPGQKLRVVAPGGELPGFELRGIGVALVELPVEKPLMARDQPFTVTWTAADGPAEVWVRITVDQHGNSPVSMICLGPDDGAVEVSAAIVNTFLDYGITGVPNYTVERRTADSFESEFGCVELRVHSTAPHDFDVEGHTPCTAAMPDCPEPLVCDLAIETCVAP